MHQNRIPPLCLLFSEGHVLSHRKRLGGASQTDVQHDTLQKGKNYAAAALGAAIFFFDFGFLSSNSKPIFPFSNFR